MNTRSCAWKKDIDTSKSSSLPFTPMCFTVCFSDEDLGRRHHCTKNVTVSRLELHVKKTQSMELQWVSPVAQPLCITTVQPDVLHGSAHRKVQFRLGIKKSHTVGDLDQITIIKDIDRRLLV